MTLQVIQNRIKEVESGHMVSGGTHIMNNCPTCATIHKLEGVEKRYLQILSHQPAFSLEVIIPL